MSDPELDVSPDAATMATHVAERLLGFLAAVQAEGRVPHVALTGGTIADAVHREVGRIHAGLHTGLGATAAPEVDWSRVELWWGDERYVPADDPERNAGQARTAFLDAVGADPTRVHAMPASDDGYESLEDAASAYADVVRNQGSGLFDLVMLGVGPDGHVASLFPGHAALDVGQAITVAVHDSPKPPPERVSLTFEALNRTREVWFLASGEGKAHAVARALGGADVDEIPATGVRGLQRTTWFLDAEAASHLPR